MYRKAHQSFAIPTPTIEFAALCLRNAVTLIEYHANQLKNKKMSDEDDVTEDEKIPCNPSSPLNRESFNKLHVAILAAYSYVLLSIGDYVMALKYGKALLAIENLPDSYA